MGDEHAATPTQAPPRERMSWQELGSGARELGLRASHVRVEVVRGHPAGALPVRDSRDRTDERRVLDVREDADVLPLLQVDPDAKRKPRILL